MDSTRDYRLKAQVYLDAKKLAVAVVRITENMPRDSKYTVGANMQRAAMNVMLSLATACIRRNGNEKLKAIENFQTEFEYLNGLFDISLDAHWIDFKAYAKVVPLVGKIGRQATAWKRSLLTKGAGQNYQG